MTLPGKRSAPKIREIIAELLEERGDYFFLYIWINRLQSSMITKQNCKSSDSVIRQPPFRMYDQGARNVLETFCFQSGPLPGANRLPFMAASQAYITIFFDILQQIF